MRILGTPRFGNFARRLDGRPRGELVPLGEVKQPGGKIVTAWAGEADYDPESLVSITFSLEWPPRSGKRAEFPEVDRAEWFTEPEARVRMLSGQVEFIDRLLDHFRAKAA